MSLLLGTPEMPVQGLGGQTGHQTSVGWAGAGILCSCCGLGLVWTALDAAPGQGFQLFSVRWPRGHCKDLVFKTNQPKSKKKPPKSSQTQPTRILSAVQQLLLRDPLAQPRQERYPWLGLRAQALLSSLSPQAAAGSCHPLLGTAQNRNRDSSEMEKTLSSIPSVPICCSTPSILPKYAF